MTLQPEQNRPAPRRINGLSLILIATAVAGIVGYLIQILVPRSVEPALAAEFVTFWSALYLVISALSGVQQELSRATTPRAADRPAGAVSTARNFGAVVSLAVLAVAVVVGAIVLPLAIPGVDWTLAIPLAVGVASYVVVATVCGTLYGISYWTAIAWMIAVDGVLRLATVVVALLAHADLIGLAWAVVIPFPLTVVVVWLGIRRGVVGKSDVDVPLGSLNWNVLRTVIAGTATGVIVSGFPFLLRASSTAAETAAITSLLVVLSLTRAPLVIPVLALQSFLVVRFRDNAAKLWREFSVIVLGILGASLVLAALAWWIGPWVVELIFAGKYDVSGVTLALLVGSAGLTGILCVSGPAVLATGKHSAFTAGWIVAAAVTVACLFLPLDAQTRAVVALSVGPLAGFAVHTVSLVGSRSAVVSAD